MSGYIGKHPEFKVGEFISSADPRRKVLLVARGDDIQDYAAHKDFIRWVVEQPAEDAPLPKPAATEVMLATEHDLYFALIGVWGICMNGPTMAQLMYGEQLGEITAYISKRMRDEPELQGGMVATREMFALLKRLYEAVK